MAVTQSIMPHFRKNNKGIVINVSSIGGKVGFPFYSYYNATKFAVEGFSEALQYELAQFNIQIKLIEPGAINTDFWSRSLQLTNMENYPEYKNLFQKVEKRMDISKGISPDRVAEVIYKAATDQSKKLRYPVGTDAKILLVIKRLFGEKIIQKGIKVLVNKK